MDSATHLRAALADAAAGSWMALGGDLEGRAVQHVVDIEALIAATARLGDRVDARTLQAALDWCVRYGWAVSGARLARVAAEMGSAGATAAFAARTAAAGGVRWPIASASPQSAATAVHRVDVMDLEARPRLAWRLRAAFGTASRADVLLTLMLSPVPVAVGEIARRTRYTKGAVVATVGGLRLAGLVEVWRIGREDHVALARDSIVAAWQPETGTQAFDMVARWHVGIEALATLESTAGMAYADAAAAQRACVEGLVGEIVAGALPWPNTKVRGPVFGVQFEFWTAALAELLSPPTARPQ
jgi:hypothetical protein